MARQGVGRDFWLDAGERLLARNGPFNLDSLDLPAEAGMSRGSFRNYWADWASYLDDLVARWTERRWRVFADVAVGPIAPTERLLALLRLALEVDNAGRVIRWIAMRDADLRDGLARSDERLYGGIVSLLRQCGLEAHDAQMRGAVLYSAFIGAAAIPLPDIIQEGDLPALAAWILAPAPQRELAGAGR